MSKRRSTASSAPRLISNLSDLLMWEAEQDRALTGVALDEQLETTLADQGAHDPTPTPYFVLDSLFAHYAFSETSHLLDVGCGTGRVLAYFLREGYPGKATGIELDPALASATKVWADRHPALEVLQGSVLDLDLAPYTDFYLFNPFDQGILQQFIEAVELQTRCDCTVIHLSDNGDTWHYVGRPGWTELASGTFQFCRNARGYRIKVYDDPQHYTVWRHEV